MLGGGIQSLSQTGVTLLINHELRTWHCHLLRVPAGEDLLGGSGAISEPSPCSALALGLLQEQSTAFVFNRVCGLLAGNMILAGDGVSLGDLGLLFVCVSTGPVEECRVFEVGSSGFSYTSCLQSLPFICRYRKGTACYLFIHYFHGIHSWRSSLG